MGCLSVLGDRALRNSLLGIAIPIALQNLLTYMTSMMDTVMLGQLGEVELSGASLANQFGTIYMVLTFGVASGANVLLSQYWGKGDTASIRSILAVAYRVALLLSLLFTAAAFLFPQAILSCFTPDREVIAAGAGYLLGMVLMVDYYGYGVLTVLVFYFARRSPWPWLLQLAGLGVINLGMMGGMQFSLSLFGRVWELPQQGLALLALLPIWLYNGRPGRASRPLRLACYAFYPVHLLLLYAAAVLLGLGSVILL